MDPTPAVTGRPPHVPTDDNRRTVELMTMAGISQEGVARVLDISVDTLTRYYRTELDTSTDKAVAKVAGSLYQKAIGDGPQAVNAAQFFLKMRGKWREHQALTIGGDPDNPLKIERVYSWRMRPPAEITSALPAENDE